MVALSVVVFPLKKATTLTTDSLRLTMLKTPAAMATVTAQSRIIKCLADKLSPLPNKMAYFAEPNTILQDFEGQRERDRL